MHRRCTHACTRHVTKAHTVFSATKMVLVYEEMDTQHNSFRLLKWVCETILYIHAHIQCIAHTCCAGAQHGGGDGSIIPVVILLGACAGTEATARASMCSTQSRTSLRFALVLGPRPSSLCTGSVNNGMSGFTELLDLMVVT